MEEETKVVDDLTVNDEQTSEESNANEGEQKEGPSKELQSAIAQKEHFRKKYEEAISHNKTEEKPAKEMIVKEVDTSSLEAKVKLIEFAQTHGDIQGSDIKEIMDIAKTKGITPDEALELPMIKTHLEAQAKAKAVADAMPDSSRGSRGTPEKPVKEMSRDEHEKYYNDLTGN